MSVEVRKTHRISDYCMMSTAGDGGDCLKFSDFILRNMDLYKITNGYDLTVRGAVHFIRRHLSAYLKSDCTFQVSLLVGGYDLTSGPELHYIDYLGNSVPVRYGGHGAAMNFCTPILEESSTMLFGQKDSLSKSETSFGQQRSPRFDDSVISRPRIVVNPLPYSTWDWREFLKLESSSG